MSVVFLLGVVWLLVALALGILIGRAIERADLEEHAQPPQADQFAQWESEFRHPSGRGWVA